MQRISAVPAILQVLSETTGLRFAAVARVTETNWTACAVFDRIEFGLKVGGELDVTTTLCSEIHASHQPIIISQVSADPDYCHHHTPQIYGFESYISVPVLRANGGSSARSARWTRYPATCPARRRAQCSNPSPVC